MGARFSEPVQTGPVAHQPLCAIDTGSLSHGYSGRGLGLSTHRNLTPRLKKQYSCTGTPCLGLHCLFWGELYFYRFHISVDKAVSDTAALFCTIRSNVFQEVTQNKNIYFPFYLSSSRKMPRCGVFQDCISVGLRVYISELTVCSIMTKLPLVSEFLLHCLQPRTVSTPVDFVMKLKYVLAHNKLNTVTLTLACVIYR